ICPDIHWEGNTYFEVKGAGLSGSVILYECRLKKDREFTRATGCRLVYWFWRHAYPVTQAASYYELRSNLAVQTKCLYLVDATLLAEAVSRSPVRRVNSG